MFLWVFFRILSTLGLIGVTLLIFRSKVHEYIKAIFFVGMMTTVSITSILSLYETIYLYVIVISMITCLVVYLLFKIKKPWYYYLGMIYAIILGLAYGWPK